MIALGFVQTHWAQRRGRSRGANRGRGWRRWRGPSVKVDAGWDGAGMSNLGSRSCPERPMPDLLVAGAGPRP